jgi:hypothetical protein
MKHVKLNFSYDKNKVREEIFSHVAEFVDIPPSKKSLKHRTFDLVDSDSYDNVTVLGESGIEYKSIPTWKGFCFTHIPNNELSTYGSNLQREMFINWEWKDNSNCPYIQSLIKNLGFTSVQTVRAMILKPPGFGPVHCDMLPLSGYYKKNISITLNIDNGGVPLVAMIDNKLVEIDDDCFIFYDNCWHGVKHVKSQRVQLRINGKIDATILNKFIEDETLYIR